MIGRIAEKQKMAHLAQSNHAELLAVVGRRRVGKTYLVREYYKDHIVFEFTGTQHADRENQLEKFAQKLGEYANSPLGVTVPKTWAEAFILLKTYLKNIPESSQKPVVFFDELPWIAGRRSGFLKEFGYWWNDWANQQNIIVVICGSAASWMMDKVVDNKGGLHNRITELIHLQPFTLAEVQTYLQAQHIQLDDYQILQLYMAIGGIPHYLQRIRRGESVSQIINRLCFSKDGILRNEFENLYAALYENPDRHIAVIKALSTKWKGLTRAEIIQKTGMSNGGGLTQVLKELLSSSFISTVVPFGKKKRETLYRLTDEFSLFYLKFMDGKFTKTTDFWLQASKQQSYKIWAGYAFENICIKHINAIKKALGIAGVHTQICGFRSPSNADEEGIQIDLIIDRTDQSINLCEMKFYNDEWTLTKEDAQKLRRRRTRFQELTGTNKTIFNTVVTTYGVYTNQHSLSQVDNWVGMEVLFDLEAFL